MRSSAAHVTSCFRLVLSASGSAFVFKCVPLSCNFLPLVTHVLNSFDLTS